MNTQSVTNTHKKIIILLYIAMHYLIHRYTPTTLYPAAPLYNKKIIIIILDTILLSRNEILDTKYNELFNVVFSLIWHARCLTNVPGISRW